MQTACAIQCNVDVVRLSRMEKKKKKRILWLYGGDCDEGQVTRTLLREQGSI